MLEPRENKLEDKFRNGFKNKVHKYLIWLQNSGDETWRQENVIL